jgi:hypothetical protein
LTVQSATLATPIVMNGFADHGLDEDAFGEKSTLKGLQTFDAFREYTHLYPTIQGIVTIYLIFPPAITPVQPS